MSKVKNLNQEMKEQKKTWIVDLLIADQIRNKNNSIFCRKKTISTVRKTFKRLMKPN